MKQILTFFSSLFLFCASALAVPEYGRFTDVLNPDYQRRIDEYLRVIDHWMEDGATYTLKETKFSRTMYIRAPHFLYRLDAPDFVLNYLEKTDRPFLNEMVNRFYEDDERSYLCLVLHLGKYTKVFDDFFLTSNTPVVTNNRQKWNREREKYRHFYIRFLGDNFGFRGKILTKFTSNDIIAPCCYEDGNYFDILGDFFRSALPTEDWLKSAVEIPGDRAAIQDWLRGFCWQWYPYDSMKPRKEFYLEKNLLRGYEVWAPLHAATNANVCALMAGVTILDGYQFDSSKGVYHLNDIGKRAVSIVAKYPHAETAFFLKTIREGGNQAYIDGLLREFGTEQTWQKLFAEAKAPPPETDPKPQEKAATPLTPTAPRKP